MTRHWDSERERNTRHGKAEILNFRSELESRLTQTIYNHLEANLDKLYGKARKIAQTKSGCTIPDEHWTLAQLLDDNFF